MINYYDHFLHIFLKLRLCWCEFHLILPKIVSGFHFFFHLIVALFEMNCSLQIFFLQSAQDSSFISGERLKICHIIIRKKKYFFYIFLFKWIIFRKIIDILILLLIRLIHSTKIPLHLRKVLLVHSWHWSHSTRTTCIIIWNHS